MKLSVISSVILLSSTSTVLAAPGTPPGKPFQGVVETLTEEIDEVKAQVSGLAVDVQALLNGQTAISNELDDIADEVSELGNTLDVEVIAHTDTCESAPVQCNSDAADAHTFDAASSSNHNPFPIRILVSKNGEPVSGLSSSQFTYNNSFVPAGGTSAIKCDVDCGADWFQGGSNGVYSMFIDRLNNDNDNWKAGNYAGMIQITDSVGASGTALVSFSLE
ncbi:hypothetical protein [Kangiella shandongensis]|uniref:hypothetical protein n=1 Tax=Kangiella shandongensis TaxID=2763258 RepID=UPI001CC02B18|nr:hypothetical protein [Kangiella shandongensis]